MNKKLIAIVVGILLLGVAGIAYAKMKAGGTGLPGSTASITGGAKSLKDLLTSGVAQKCTYSTTEGTGTSEGTTYISGGKMRGDFSTTVSGKVTKSHMITDGKSSYIWTDGEKTGFKSTIADTTTGNAPDTTNTTANVSGQGSGLNQKADYKCLAWVTDGSFFTAPSDIKFTDLSEMFKVTPAPAGKAGTTDNTSQCAVCDSLSGTDKTQCLSSLNCK